MRGPRQKTLWAWIVCGGFLEEAGYEPDLSITGGEERAKPCRQVEWQDGRQAYTYPGRPYWGQEWEEGCGRLISGIRGLQSNDSLV